MSFKPNPPRSGAGPEERSSYAAQLRARVAEPHRWGVDPAAAQADLDAWLAQQASQARADAKAEAAAQAKAEADAQAKAEADAQAKAEADAKAKAEADAKAEPAAKDSALGFVGKIFGAGGSAPPAGAEGSAPEQTAAQTGPAPEGAAPTTGKDAPDGAEAKQA